MSCGACSSVVEEIDPSKNGLKYALKDPDTRSVDGKTLIQAFIAPAKAPRGGWSFGIYLSGHYTIISKSSPKAVASEVERLLQLNEILYSPAQLWLNLNLHWLGRTVDRNQRIKITQLLDLAQPLF